jgi:multiple sugar transport system substrate-binding protein
VTPVFNGSASLRNAAGQLVENVTKSVRRNQVVHEKYMENMFKDIFSLYRLDSLDPTNAKEGKKDLGEMPVQSKILLCSLGTIWIVLAIYTIYSKVKAKKQCT